MRTIATLLFLTAILAVQTWAACTSQGDTATRTGQATYYGAYTNGGACSLDPTPYSGTNGIKTTVAIANNIWNGGAACGMCVNITSKGTGSGGSPLYGSFLAYVNNQCPSCDPSGIDLGLNGDGVWDITWKPVPCRVDSKYMQFKFEGSHNYYLKMQVRNVRYPVAAVSVIQNGAEKVMTRTSDSFWLGSSVSYPINAPFQVKITATTGDFVIDTVPSITNGVVLEGTTQFLDCSPGSGSGSVAATSGKVATTSAAAASTSGKVATTSAAATTATGKGATTTTAAAAASTVTGKAATTTTTGKTATATTGSATTGTQVREVVYDDIVKAPFQDWSWATVDPKATTPVFAGTYSYSFIPVSHQAAYFSYPGGIKPALYSALEFYIRLSYTLGNEITFALIKSDVPAVQAPVSSYSGAIPANTWTKVTVPFSSLSDTYDGFWFQDATGKTSNPKVYLDSISLIRK